MNPCNRFTVNLMNSSRICVIRMTSGFKKALVKLEVFSKGNTCSYMKYEIATLNVASSSYV